MSAASAGELSLDATADGNTRFYSYFSASFCQLDQGWSNSQGASEEIDGFFALADLPDFTPIGSGVDFFPREEDFEFGTVTYDDTTITGIGMESVPVTGLNLTVGGNFRDGRATVGELGNDIMDTITVIRSIDPESRVELVDGVPRHLFLTAFITLDYELTDGAEFDGVFTVFGDKFTLLVDGTYDTGIPNPNREGETFKFRQRWDSTGVIDALQPDTFQSLIDSVVTKTIQLEVTLNHRGHAVLNWDYGEELPDTAWGGFTIYSVDDQGSHEVIADGLPINTREWTDFSPGLHGIYSMQFWYIPFPQ
ncbi:MAG: hypothetical protein AAGA58_12840 [Verrucomicrobiota bacterium]